MSSSKPTVAFQGEYGAFSEMAARSYFGQDVTVSPQPDFAHLFRAVESGEATHGMVPIENTLMGSIFENNDHLLRHDLSIVGETKLRIVHNLIVNAGVTLDDIREIHSQPPALAQCVDFIQSLPNARAVAAHDTAGAARGLRDSGDRTTAAIASRQAAVDYSLEILCEGIEDNHQNFTRFVVVAPEAVNPEAPAKTSIVFTLNHEPGSLYAGLGALAERNINMMKIESRPIAGRPFEYTFYVDIAGDQRDDLCREALERLESHTTTFKILGSYKEGNIVEGAVRPPLTE